MAFTRRRLIQSAALSAGALPAAKAEPEITLDALRQLSSAQGVNLTADRLRVIKPVLDRRLAQLQTFREFEIDDSVAPALGILHK